MLKLTIVFTMSIKTNSQQKNVLGETLEECSLDPLTGWLRDGCCNTDENDHGVHTVCAKVTTECLEWLKASFTGLEHDMEFIAAAKLKEKTETKSSASGKPF